MSFEKVSAAEYQNWLNHDVTKKVFLSLRNYRANILEGLAAGETLGHGCGSNEATAKSVGVVRGIDLILKIEVTD